MSSLAGSFLVAKTILRDPNFTRSVVLLLQHGSEGAFGLVINRPAQVEGLPFKVFVGGPCPSPGLMLLHGHPAWEDEDKTPVLPGVFLGDTDSFKRVHEAGENSGLRYRLFSGYSGWGAGQLERELAAGAWAVVPGDSEYLFDTPVDEVWLSLIPPAIPQPSLN